MGLFDILKKKKAAKAPAQDLEAPPAPDGGMPPAEAVPPPASEQPFSGMEQSPQFPPMDFSQRQMPMQQFQTPDFPLPQRNAPGMRQMPEMMPQPQPGAQQQMQQAPVPEDGGVTGMMQYEEMPMPAPPAEMQEFAQQQQMPMSSPQAPPANVQSMFGSPTPRFKFYQAAESTVDHAAHGAEVPFDISQELLTMPELHKQAHPEVYREMHEEAHEDMEQPYTFLQKETTASVKKIAPAGPHISRQFITVTTLFEVGEQLVNMSEDLGLAKDTVFRITDLNEQEIEQMAKWQALQQSMELRIAEVDKILFKA